MKAESRRIGVGGNSLSYIEDRRLRPKIGDPKGLLLDLIWEVVDARLAMRPCMHGPDNDDPKMGEERTLVRTLDKRIQALVGSTTDLEMLKKVVERLEKPRGDWESDRARNTHLDHRMEETEPKEFTRGDWMRVYEKRIRARIEEIEGR